MFKKTREARVFLYAFLLFFVLSLFFVFTSYGQDTTRIAKSDTTLTINGKTAKYPVYVGSRGGKYVIVTSKKGTTYKKYLPR